MIRYKITVSYKGSPFSSEFEHLTVEQAEQCLGAFTRDMFGLAESAVSKIVIERESDDT